MKTRSLLLLFIIVLGTLILISYFKTTSQNPSSSNEPQQNTQVTLQGEYNTEPHIYQKKKFDDGVSVRAYLVEGDEYWEGLKKEAKNKYGSVVEEYWPDYLVEGKQEFDVDLDQANETILTLAVPEVNHPPHRVDIIKDGKIIFSYEDYKPRIEDEKTGNGF